MKKTTLNKRKIINDPVHGFIKIPHDIIYDLLEHPALQRLRRIKQLGLTEYVYPAASHSRLSHTLGAMHLMMQAIAHLRLRNIGITTDEEIAVLIAILLHDIGHGPFSHALEETFIDGVCHEDISEELMKQLNVQFNHQLELAIKIFKNEYPKKFLHQLVSGQLDMDRMDYLKRDSFFTGVTEGIIGSDRIIKMLNVVDDMLVIEEKGIYSIEKFLIARRLMYWQVYFHKTVIASEYLLVKIINRIRHLLSLSVDVFLTPPLKYFLGQNITSTYYQAHKSEVIHQFLLLDDTDILASAKVWIQSEDKILSELANNLLNRRLPKVSIEREPIAPQRINALIDEISAEWGIAKTEAEYLISHGEVNNRTYSEKSDSIKILTKHNQVVDIAKASDVLNISNFDTAIKKYFICSPKIAGIEE